MLFFRESFLKYLLFIMAHRLKIYIISFLCMKGKNSSNNSEIPFLRNKSIHAQHYVKDDYTVVIFNITDLVISSACFLEVLINIADMANRAFSAKIGIYNLYI